MIYLLGTVICLVIFPAVCSLILSFSFSLGTQGLPWVGIKQLVVSKIFTLYHWMCVFLEGATIV